MDNGERGGRSGRRHGHGAVCRASHYAAQVAPQMTGAERLTLAGHAHRCHRRFFPSALEPQDPHFGVTKDAADCGVRTKAREALRVDQSSRCAHLQSMPLFLVAQNSANPCPEPLSRAQAGFLTHSIGRKPLSSSSPSGLKFRI